MPGVCFRETTAISEWRMDSYGGQTVGTNRRLTVSLGENDWASKLGADIMNYLLKVFIVQTLASLGLIL